MYSDDMTKLKAIIIGTSLAGKTTLIRYLREVTDWPVSEIDEEVSLRNGGVWPKDIAYKNEVLVPSILAKVLTSDEIVFFTNTFYFSPEVLQTARDNGFSIVQLYVDREVMEKRNIYRMAHESYDDQQQWFDGMLEYQRTIQELGLVDTVIQTDKPVATVAAELKKFLDQG